MELCHLKHLSENFFFLFVCFILLLPFPKKVIIKEHRGRWFNTQTTVCRFGCHSKKGHKAFREYLKEGCRDGEGSEGKVCEERLRPLSVLSAEQRS